MCPVGRTNQSHAALTVPSSCSCFPDDRVACHACTRNKYLSYLRVSTDKQAEEGLGLAAQEKAIRAFLRDRRARSSHLFEDRGVSGAVEDRPALSELLQSLQPGDVVLVARLDRLARDLLVQEVLLRDIRHRGADLASCSQQRTSTLGTIRPIRRGSSSGKYSGQSPNSRGPLPVYAFSTVAPSRAKGAASRSARPRSDSEPREANSFRNLVSRKG
jgi:hypothetical protein